MLLGWVLRLTLQEGIRVLYCKPGQKIHCWGSRVSPSREATCIVWLKGCAGQIAFKVAMFIAIDRSVASFGQSSFFLLQLAVAAETLAKVLSMSG